MARALAAFLALFYFATVGYGSPHEVLSAHPAGFSITQARQLLTDRPLDVETWMKGIDPAYRAYFVLQYKSGSLHLASPLRPRIIFFGPDARLLTAISTDPADPRYNTVEFIEYDAREARFQFYEGTFGGDKPAQIVAAKNCTLCHRGDSRPNWEPYSTWPGTYGSLHDRTLPRTTESKWLGELISHLSSVPRLRELGKFYEASPSFNGDKTYFTVTRSVGPGASLTILANFLNRERISRKITESPLHARYRYAIAAGLLGCKEVETFLPDNIRRNHPLSFETIAADTKQNASMDYERRLTRSLELLDATDSESVRQISDQQSQWAGQLGRLTALRYLLENRKNGAIDADDWSLSREIGSYNFNDGSNGLINLIGHYLPRAFSERERQELGLKVKTIPFGFTSYETEAKQYPLEFYEPQIDEAKTCELLKQKSLGEDSPLGRG